MRFYSYTLKSAKDASKDYQKNNYYFKEFRGHPALRSIVEYLENRAGEVEKASCVSMHVGIYATFYLKI